MSVRKVAMACSVCGHRNYFIPEKKERTERLTLNKFCKYCGKVTPHQETR
ncbi:MULTISPECIES: 50S ribosomal protein L33 [Lacticaseibacillus]|jgi:large subunit ribosomal protein L33|uniref:Large ribosomal subunit protein bL33 n=1 Tax=Lacticaseibacillus pantheris DSM 15945 = JCM 12539 = NBRC 106106 TaxID=1423783 RepID=A0A0R1U7V9_9LACO|nr:MULTISPECIES: 50S ribosomal protein L33 [Lacticaseibacillus]KRL87026.1 hypothetical protein FC50_GL000227 [Lacticaseibacillus pantheris DSM 15945 = JCM 12539 = NBRC 106106]WKF85954.1 50S ribosomal protein L33 [Lacticaseibacillus pantheris]